MRFFKVHNHKKSFFCALCRAPRTTSNARHLNASNYFQIAVLTAFLTWTMFEWFEWKTLGSFFIIWAGFEFTRKVLYRKELKCPYCGFDATWYRKDVRIARRQVEDFVKDNPQAKVYRSARVDEDDQVYFQ